MPFYSHSRLNTFDQCPLQYKYRYIDRVPVDRENIEAFTGKLVHRVLEDILKAGEPVSRTGLPRAIERYETLWRQEWSDRVRVVKTDLGPGHYRSQGLNCLRNFFELEDTRREVRTLALEEKVTVRLDSGGRYRMLGFIDRLVEGEDGTHEIHDYKTSGRLPARKALDEDRQLAIYQLGLEERMGRGARFRLVWHYLVFKRSFRSSRSPDQLETLRRDLIERIRRIEAAREFPARVGPLCRWCVYEEICPDRRAQLSGGGDSERSRVEEGKRLVDRYVALVLESRRVGNPAAGELEGHREALVAHSLGRGVDTVFGGTHAARIRRHSRISLPPPGTERRTNLENLLRKEDLWDGSSEVDPHRILRMVEERPESSRLKEILSSHGGIIEETCEVQLLPHGGGQLRLIE